MQGQLNSLMPSVNQISAMQMQIEANNQKIATLSDKLGDKLEKLIETVARMQGYMDAKLK
jgi:hypothetical protein